MRRSYRDSGGKVFEPIRSYVEHDKVYITSAQDSNIKGVQLILLESEQWVRSLVLYNH